MKKQELRDAGGRLVGTIDQGYGGQIEGRDAGGRLRGTFDPKSNETRDSGGRLVGKGDLLSSLLFRR